jgi:hypothetical protein
VDCPDPNRIRSVVEMRDRERRRVSRPELPSGVLHEDHVRPRDSVRPSTTSQRRGPPEIRFKLLISKVIFSKGLRYGAALEGAGQAQISFRPTILTGSRRSGGYGPYFLLFEAMGEPVRISSRGVRARSGTVRVSAEGVCEKRSRFRFSQIRATAAGLGPKTDRAGPSRRASCGRTRADRDE